MNKTASAPENGVDPVSERVPTADGTRIEIGEINVGSSVREPASAAGNWFQRARSKFSLFLAGMYTGIGCSGVPHSHHTYRHDRDKGPI